MSNATSATATGSIAEPKSNVKIRFAPNSGFERELNKRVNAYLENTSNTKRNYFNMYLKSFLAISWVIVSYCLIVFSGLPVWGIILASVSLSFALNALSFNVMHDAIHGAYSKHKIVNKLMGHWLDLIGGSSYIWNFKHNHDHHSYPNITGHDGDVEVGVFARFTPHQKKYFFHRFQHIYIWFLYGFLAIKWHLIDDFYNYFTGKLNGHDIERPKGMDAVIFFGGKIFFFIIVFVVPSLYYPVPYVIGFYVLIAMMQGVIMSLVFQLAHCVEEAEFPMQDEEAGIMDRTWIVHQIYTTVDFARGNKLLTWYLGGLNYQVEHHLHPKICHINYPEMSRIVEETCKEYGVPYSAHGGFLDGVRSHYNWLRELAHAP
ncbi:acyl-CoA desaturase [Desulfobacterota bacterium AH_259_B03_O07]|nr:acyl-CoA desaturase [Desulfobacterota bacterium AH_259_B03_O07]